MPVALADLLYDLLLRCCRVLPPAFAWWLGGVIGDAVARLPGVEQQRCRLNLQRLVPQHRIPALSRRVFRHVGRSVLWSLATLDRDPRHLQIRIEGREHLKATLRAARVGNGTVILSGHIGNWELLARLFGCLTPTAVLGRRLRRPWLDRLVTRLRTQWGNRAFYQDDDLRQMASAIRSGLVLGTLPDQDVGRISGGFVPFFGELAYTPLGPVAIAQVARAAVQAIVCYHDGRHWVLHVGPRWPVPRCRDRVAQQLELMARWSRYFEALVRQHPEQWVWFHRRWRRKPKQRPEAPVWDGKMASAG